MFDLLKIVIKDILEFHKDAFIPYFCLIN